MTDSAKTPQAERVLRVLRRVAMAQASDEGQIVDFSLVEDCVNLEIRERFAHDRARVIGLLEKLIDDYLEKDRERD